MATLIITRGLPASGKSTWARAWVAEDEPNRARVNRDDLRNMICGRYWPAPETAVTVAEKAVIRGLLGSGRSVVVDATHLRLSHAKEMAKLASECNVEFKVQDFPTDVSECLARDWRRQEMGERFVGQDIITEMAKKYGLHKKWLPPVILADDILPSYRWTANPSLPSAWLVDIDGTIAHMNGRGPFDWHRVGEDHIDETIDLLVCYMMDRAAVIFLSGRDESCREQTEAWLVKYGIEGYEDLFMRPAGDTRKDSIVKLELFRKHVASYYNVLGVLDDRDQVVKMWRQIGLKCLQVAEGDF